MTSNVLPSGLAQHLAMPDSDIVLSIRREPAQRIFDKKKIFELRKQLPRGVPRRVFLYQTESSGTIVGHVVVERVLGAPTPLLWDYVGAKAATKERFFEYFSGWDTAYAYEIRHAVKYRKAINLNEPSFDNGAGRQGVQSFVYLRNDPGLASKLANHAFLESARTVGGRLTIRPIQSENQERFLKGVEEHISSGYLETGRKYGETLLGISKKGDDVEGIFTLRKWVLEVQMDGRLAGFVVVTEKLGGSVKTGPTFFLKKYRDKGLGVRLRAKLHTALERFGARKVYATVPADNAAACRYLLSSGYRIEAHLRKQYHSKHDEFVYGFLFERFRGESSAIATRDFLPLDSVAVATPVDNDVAEFVEHQMRIFVPTLPVGWGKRQIESALAFTDTRIRTFKTRAIFIARAGSEIHAAAFCIIKRGGSAKMWLLTKTTDRSSIGGFVAFVENALRLDKKNPIRKFYSTIPLHDSNLVRVFEDAEYSIEGVLDRPYSNNCDLVVFGKSVS